MKEVVLFTLVFASIGHVTTKRPYMSIVLQKCTSYCNPKYCNVSTVCRPLNRTSKFVSMDIYYHPGVKLEALTYVEVVSLKKFATVYRQNMVKFKTDFCKELSLRTHPFFHLLDNTIFGNMLDPCPITGHRYYKPRITNVGDYKFIKVPILPAGEWRMDYTISQERNSSEVVIVQWSDYYEVKALTAEQF